MKKFKSILFVVCLLITTMLPTLNLNAQFASGTGTQTDPYIITNATHMEYLADMVESQPTG